MTFLEVFTVPFVTVCLVALARRFAGTSPDGSKRIDGVWRVVGAAAVAGVLVALLQWSWPLAAAWLIVHAPPAHAALVGGWKAVLAVGGVDLLRTIVAEAKGESQTNVDLRGTDGTAAAVTTADTARVVDPTILPPPLAQELTPITVPDYVPTIVVKP